jgi:hypothetical protein
VRKQGGSHTEVGTAETWKAQRQNQQQCRSKKAMPTTSVHCAVQDMNKWQPSLAEGIVFSCTSHD